jgi:uncharacterized protein (TIGR03000 family)
MYSIVMLAAMSAGADVTPMAPPPTPVTVAPSAAPVVVGCCGGSYSSCYGCCGGYSAYYACSGCCGGYYSSCYGCCGGGRSGFLGHKHRHGCCGGYTCFGCCCGGWYSAGYGCSGLSCYGSCYGSSCSGCTGYGSVWGPPVGMPPYTLHGYNTPGAPVWGAGYPIVGGCYGSPQAVYGNTYYPNPPPAVSVPVTPMTKPSSDNPPGSGANLKFDLPADAKLFVDGKPVANDGMARTFYTPALEPGKNYFYEVHAERTVDGKVVATEKKQVIVAAGKAVTVSYDELTGTSSVVKK